MMSGISVRFMAKYSTADIFPRTSPLTMTWEPTSVTGLRRMGFISTDGSTPAASAWTTWARPISSPSRVMKELSAMFWLLKGATR